MTSSVKARSISIIIPAFNEENNIQGSIDASVYAAEKNFDDYEIIVVNDGSTDGTLSIVEKNMEKNKKIRVVSHSTSRGFGASFKTGLKHSRKKYTVMVHGDDVFEKEDLSHFLSNAGKADVILGYIANPESRDRLRRVLSRTYTHLMNILFQMHLRYFNGIQIHETHSLKAFGIVSDGFGFMAEMAVKAVKQKKRYLEIPYRHRERPGGGKTKIFKIKNILSMLKTIMHLVGWVYRHSQQHPCLN